jgi:hypothetical protein
MDTLTLDALIAGLLGGVAAIATLLLLDLLRRRRHCPQCATALPRIRRHTNQRQGLWGGWTCPRCGCEVDRNGLRIRCSRGVESNRL